MPGPNLVGCDFSSSPSRRKPIVLALGTTDLGVVCLDRLERLESLDCFAAWLQQPGPWVGAFDFPFGLPRELVQQLGWPQDWSVLMTHYASLERSTVRDNFAAFCQARPAGQKFAHRATDRPAGSSPSMKWVNPPVAYMLHAGAPRLLAAGVHIPGLHAGDPHRVALEGYPGLLARELLGQRSYKSDDKAKQTPERQQARQDLVRALVQGTTRLGLRLQLSAAQSHVLVNDASGDSLDAVMCLVQAAWAAAQGTPRYGLPAEVDPIEGWIVTA
jgi:hypothetical protein